MLWLAVLRQAGRGNRESLYNTVLLIEIIWHCLKSQHYFEDGQKPAEKVLCAFCSGQLFIRCFIFFTFIPFFSFFSGVWLPENDLSLWVFLSDLTLLFSHRLGILCLTHPPPLPFLSAESGSVQVLVSPPRSSSRSPLCSLTAEKPAAEWLDGTDPFPTHLRPLTEQRQEDQTLLQSEKTHLNHQRHSPRWQPTGSTNCDTWPTSPAPCTHSPLTPCGATPPLTCWPVATSLAGLGQTFPKKWLHCVSNRKQQLWLSATCFCEKRVFTEILFVFALRS